MIFPGFSAIMSDGKTIYTEAYRSGHNGPDSKSGSPHGLVGSNPTASATSSRTSYRSRRLFCKKSSLTHSVAPPFPTRPASLGSRGGPDFNHGVASIVLGLHKTRAPAKAGARDLICGGESGNGGDDRLGALHAVHRGAGDAAGVTGALAAGVQAG